jgi:hypothetical protein
VVGPSKSVLDAIGKTFGNRTVVSFAERRKYMHYVLVRCKCGRESVVPISSLRRGKSVSCRKCMMVRHGGAINGTQTPTYSSYRAMMSRCYSVGHKGGKDYRKRGIVVCKRWRTDYRNFLADMGERPPGMTIDRLDVNGNYEPGNCRWATMFEQGQNRRNSVRVPYDGRLLSIREVSQRTGVPIPTIYHRFRRSGEIVRVNAA